jgi:transcriptional regulator with XRE-family HTH domain
MPYILTFTVPSQAKCKILLAYARYLLQTATMNSFVDAIRRVRGEMTFVEMAGRTGISRQTLMAMEAGLPTKLSTLRQIAQRCKLPDDQWEELLTAWVESELGPKDFARLNKRLSPKFEQGGDVEKLLLTVFNRLNNSEKQAVLMTMMAKPVRDMLPSLNELFVVREFALKKAPKMRQEFPDEFRKIAEKCFGAPKKPAKG